jgi:hypothetical protein
MRDTQTDEQPRQEEPLVGGPCELDGPLALPDPELPLAPRVRKLDRELPGGEVEEGGGDLVSDRLSDLDLSRHLGRIAQ